jgi:hypothetical protein
MNQSELRQRFQSLRVIRVIAIALYGMNSSITGIEALPLTQSNKVPVLLNFAAVLIFVFAAYWSYFRDSLDRMRSRMDAEQVANSLKSQTQTSWLLLAVGAFMLTLHLSRSLAR